MNIVTKRNFIDESTTIEIRDGEMFCTAKVGKDVSRERMGELLKQLAEAVKAGESVNIVARANI